MLIYALLDFFMNETYIHVSTILILVSAIALAGGMMLHFERFIHLWGINLECGRQGKIYRTKIEGLCPSCGSSLKIRNVGSSENKKLMLLCRRNSFQHRWNFDFTVLPEI